MCTSEMKSCIVGILRMKGREKGGKEEKGGGGRKDGDEEGNKTFQLKFKIEA